jgi:AcrR family transcriptional regulator
MKHVPGSLQGDFEARVRVPTRRALAKQQTRVKVLAAARKLFSEAGYEGATIRDIAAAAGMSTGAVFANFADKSDLFREIMVADLESLAEVMREAAVKGRTVDDALLRAFAAGYGFYKSQLPLARAAFSISWSHEQGQELRNLGPVQDLHNLIAEQLQFGVERGELSQEAEIKLRTEMLFDSYLANYPEAIFQGWSLDALQAKARDQIRVILAGARRG